MARIIWPFSLSSSRRPMAVEMMPGLIELIRAPRRPHDFAAAATRIRLARFAKGYAN